MAASGSQTRTREVPPPRGRSAIGRSISRRPRRAIAPGLQEIPRRLQPSCVRRRSAEPIKAQIGWGHMLLRRLLARPRKTPRPHCAGSGLPRAQVTRMRSTWWAVAIERGWGHDHGSRGGRALVPPGRRQKGHAWAQYNLGKLLARGHAGNKDPRVAFDTARARGPPRRRRRP